MRICAHCQWEGDQKNDYSSLALSGCKENNSINATSQFLLISRKEVRKRRLDNLFLAKIKIEFKSSIVV